MHQLIAFTVDTDLFQHVDNYELDSNFIVMAKQ